MSCTPFQSGGRRRLAGGGFSLVEVVVAMGVVGLAFLALYSGIAYAFSQIRMFRENARATQILVEKMETIRLYNWDQINGIGFKIPDRFSTTYSPADTNNQGVVYSGKLNIERLNLGTNYEDQMRRVVLTLTWKTGRLERERSLTTYVSQNGLHSHIFQEHFH